MSATPTVVVHHPKTGEPITINQSDYLANMSKYKLFKAGAPSEAKPAPAPAPEPVAASGAADAAPAEAAAGATEESEPAKGKKKSKIFS